LDSKLKTKDERLIFRDGITKNGFDHPKFNANASILVLKKIGGGGYYYFIFS
jgi:hypothetical protein